MCARFTQCERVAVDSRYSECGELREMMRPSTSLTLLALLSFTRLGGDFLASTGVQVTVDATKQLAGPVRRGPWPGSNSPGHSAALPIRLELLVPTGHLSPEGTILVDFLITNVGSGPIRIASSPFLRQPSGTNRPYSLLTLWLTSDVIKKQYAKDQQTGRLFEIGAVVTSAQLYADSDSADSLALLPPAASMLVHASSGVQLNAGSHPITAHAWLERISNGTAELVGTADSETLRRTFTELKP
jgi:hypothetical protein